MEMLMHKKKKDLKIAQHSLVDPTGHKKANKGQKIYNKGKSTDNPNEKETFLKRTNPRLPLAKNKSKKRDNKDGLYANILLSASVLLRVAVKKCVSLGAKALLLKQISSVLQKRHVKSKLTN